MSAGGTAGVGRLVLLFVSPLAAEMAALADRLSWPVTVIDPDRTRLDGQPVPYARTCLSVAEARLDDSCDVVVCDDDRPELVELLAEVLDGPGVRRLCSAQGGARVEGVLRGRGVPERLLARLDAPVGLDLGARQPPEAALATVAGLLADRNGRTGGRLPVTATD